MSMTVAQIRSWLLSQPRPVALRVVTADDDRHEIAVAGSTWMKVAQAIHALTPARIEGFDADGKLLKACRPDEAPPEDDGGDEQQAGSPAAVKAAELPAGADPNVVMLTHFADLLARAYEHSTHVAFEKLAALFEISQRRSESLERSLDSLQRLLTRAARDKLEAEANGEVPSGGGLLQQMLADFLAGQASAAAGAATHGDHTSNGKAEP